MFLCLRAQHPALQAATTSLPEKRCIIKSLVAYMHGQWAFTTPLLPVKTKHIAKWGCQAAANEAEACQRATPAFCNNPQDSALIGNSECQARNIEHTDVLCKFKVEHEVLHFPTSLSRVWTVELVFNLCDIFLLFAHTIGCQSLSARLNAHGVVCELPLLRVVWATITSEQQ